MSMLRHRTLLSGSSVCVWVRVVVCVEVVTVTDGRVVGRSVTGTTEIGTVGNGGSVGIEGSVKAAVGVVVDDVVATDFVASLADAVDVVGAVVVAVNVLVLLVLVIVLEMLVVGLLLLLLLLLMELLALVFGLVCALAEPMRLEVETPNVVGGEPVAGVVWVTVCFCALVLG